MRKKLSKIQKTEFEYIIRAISSSINNTTPPIPYDEINWDRLLAVSKQCGVSALFANSMLRLDDAVLPAEVKKRLTEQKNQELVVDTILNYEAEKILKAFDRYKIKNCPVKGYFLKQEYPRNDFRSVSDFDILFDVKDADSLKSAFAEIGYEFLHNDDNQYHFQKKPYMYIEMHTTLVHAFESYYPFLYNQLDRTVKRDGYSYSYQMIPEDHYVYLTVHSSNHLRIAGLGMRMVLDTYIYFKNHKDDFDMKYLDSRLEQLGLKKFESRLRKIAYNWFSSDTPNISFDDFESFILLSGRLGRVEVAVMASSYKKILAGKRKSKFSHLLATVFPDKSRMELDYPYLKKAPFLLPISWGTMLFRRMFIDKNINAKRVLHNHLSYSDEDVLFYKGILQEAGFDSFFGK